MSSIKDTASQTVRSTLTRRQVLTRGALIGLSLPILGVSLASCGTRAGDETATGGGSGAKAITIAINESPWLAAFQKLAAEYKESTGTTVTLRSYPPDNLQAKQMAAVQNKSDEFDVFTMFGTWYGSFYKAGFLAPFSSIDPSFQLDSEVITYDNLVRWDAKENYFSPDGDVMTVSANGNFQIFYYRADIYAKLGLQIPKTYEEVIANARKIMDKGAAPYGYAVRGQKGSNSATVGFLPVLRGMGGDIFANPPKDWTVTINDDTALKAMDLYMKLAALGPKNPQSIGQAELIALMQSGKLAQATMVSAAAANLQDSSQSSVVGKIGYAVIPGPAGGSPAPLALPALAGIPNHISKDQKKAAYDFLTWLITKKSQTQFGQDGGSPARTDVLSSDLAQKHPEYGPMLDSVKIATRDVAFPFAPALLQVTEQEINEIVGGIKSPKEGLDAAAAGIESVLTKAGYR